jgi:hypothetical protein
MTFSSVTVIVHAVYLDKAIQQFCLKRTCGPVFLITVDTFLAQSLVCLSVDEKKFDQLLR